MYSLSWDVQRLKNPRWQEQQTAQETARAQVGDGKFPNKYWVSIGNQWLTNFPNKGEHSYEWAGEVYDDLEEGLYEIYGPFATFKEARSKADDLSHSCYMPSPDDHSGKHNVVVEDRLTGTIMDGAYREYFSDDDDELPEYEWEWQDDSRFAREMHEKRGIPFV